MVQNKLHKALSSVDWNANVSEFVKDHAASEAVSVCNMRLALWSKQFEIVDKDNPALSFIREMQVAGHHVSALTSLSLYKPAASAMRTVLETALYYTYFRTHPAELSTLVRDSKYFLYKKELIDYHMVHTPQFTQLQEMFGLNSRLSEWYSKVSSIIHGQIPGIWVAQKSLTNTKHVRKTLSIVVKYFTEVVDIVSHLFLCTAGRELWKDFSSSAKRQLLSGIHGNIKAELGLDSA